MFWYVQSALCTGPSDHRDPCWCQHQIYVNLYEVRFLKIIVRIPHTPRSLHAWWWHSQCPHRDSPKGRNTCGMGYKKSRRLAYIPQPRHGLVGNGRLHDVPLNLSQSSRLPRVTRPTTWLMQKIIPFPRENDRDLVRYLSERVEGVVVVDEIPELGFVELEVKRKHRVTTSRN